MCCAVGEPHFLGCAITSALHSCSWLEALDAAWSGLQVLQLQCCRQDDPSVEGACHHLTRASASVTCFGTSTSPCMGHRLLSLSSAMRAARGAVPGSEVSCSARQTCSRAPGPAVNLCGSPSAEA